MTTTQFMILDSGQANQAIAHAGLPTASNLASNRFYPDAMPSFPYEPTRDRFDIARVGDTIGEGVITYVSFQPGEIVFAFTGFLSSAITQFSLQLSEGLHVHDPYFAGKILHHCDPNTTVDMQRQLFIAKRPIQPYEYITMDYAETEDYLFKTFHCECNAPHCRGLIKGRKQ